MKDLVPTTAVSWTARMAFDLALLLEGSGLGSVKELLHEHGIGKGDLELYSRDPVFQGSVLDYREQIREGGLSFKFKARLQAEELLRTSWELIHSPSVSAVVKADLIKSTVKWAGLEVRGAESLVVGGSVPHIVINLGYAAGAGPREIKESKVIAGSLGGEMAAGVGDVKRR